MKCKFYTLDGHFIEETVIWPHNFTGIQLIPNVEKRWLLNGMEHRNELDGPAIERDTGDKEWWINGLRHRQNGPAVELSDGTKQWWINGLKHRTHDPAVEWHDGSKEWFANGKRHRLGGPAIEENSSTKYYFIYGTKTTKEGHDLYIDLLKFNKRIY